MVQNEEPEGYGEDVKVNEDYRLNEDLNDDQQDEEDQENDEEQPQDESQEEIQDENETHPALTYEKLMEENIRLKSELENKEKEICKLDADNLKLKETDIKRNQDFFKFKKEHSELLKEVESLRHQNPPQIEAEGETQSTSEELQRLQEENDALREENEDLKQSYEEQLAAQVKTYSSEYAKLESEKRKLELKLDSQDVEIHKNQSKQSAGSSKLSDNKEAHYQSMKKDIQRLIEFKNELESLVEQQNTELELKNND